MSHGRTGSPSLALAALVVAGALFAAAAPGVAGEKRAKRDAKAHLEFRPTYAQALMEARIRNVPVFVSRHKDF